MLTKYMMHKTDDGIAGIQLLVNGRGDRHGPRRKVCMMVYTHS